MPEGLSTNRNCQDMADCLLQSGKAFVVRYHASHTLQPQKRLTPREAAMLARAGLDIATIYQDRATEPEDFGQARGEQDGRAAFTFASQVGQPPGSAIYFAVDADMSMAQINDAVLPYFRGVRAGLAAMAGAGDGNTGFRVGVYGSGRVCQRVKENHALAELSWLAQSPGWADSATYATWDMRQGFPGGPLCALGLQWEPVEARGDAGAFRPIGADVTAAQGVELRVTAPELFLRHVPTTQGNQPIARMRQGQVVRLLGDAAPPWKRVRATIGGADVVGFASGRFLEPLAGSPVLELPVAAATVPPVHFRPGNPLARRDSTAGRASPLGESGRPGLTPGAGGAQRVAELGALVAWMDVEHSARWQPGDGVTFCNVYAADFCFLAGVYLPRTWWKEKALMAIAGGQTPDVVYDETIREMRADDLLAWLSDFGPQFGWQRVFDASALQAAANAGGVGLICADRDAVGRPGHITAVLAETAAMPALRDVDGNVLLPVQTQAGSVNRARFTGQQSGIGAWWLDAKFRDRGFFVNMPNA
jgi:hypothetical protein